jgi:hypothetical protein
LKSWKGGKYRDLAGVKEAFCTKNSQLLGELEWVDRLIKNKRMNFYKALFICLLLSNGFSVDRLLQANGIKACSV